MLVDQILISVIPHDQCVLQLVRLFQDVVILLIVLPLLVMVLIVM